VAESLCGHASYYANLVQVERFDRDDIAVHAAYERLRLAIESTRAALASQSPRVDPTRSESGQEQGHGLAPVEAREIAAEDPSLIYLSHLDSLPASAEYAYARRCARNVIAAYGEAEGARATSPPFTATADVRETSQELIDAIFEVSGRNEDHAVRIWDGDASPAELLAVWEIVTENGMREPSDYVWGTAGSRWWASRQGAK
jgi:hypothetical protein